jgi:hypothetical protein
MDHALDDLVVRIQSSTADAAIHVVAIDGRSGSGKSTLARSLAQRVPRTAFYCLRHRRFNETDAKRRNTPQAASAIPRGLRLPPSTMPVTKNQRLGRATGEASMYVPVLPQFCPPSPGGRLSSGAAWIPVLRQTHWRAAPQERRPPPANRRQPESFEAPLTPGLRRGDERSCCAAWPGCGSALLARTQRQWLPQERRAPPHWHHEPCSTPPSEWVRLPSTAPPSPDTGPSAPVHWRRCPSAGG